MMPKITSIKTENKIVDNKDYPRLKFIVYKPMLTRITHRLEFNGSHFGIDHNKEARIRSGLDNRINSAQSSISLERSVPDEGVKALDIVGENIKGVSTDVKLIKADINKQENKISQLLEKIHVLYEILTIGQLPDDMWVDFLKSKEEEGVDVYDSSLTQDLSEEFRDLKYGEYENIRKILDAEVGAKHALNLSLNHLKDLLKDLEEVDGKLKSGSVNEVPESLKINYGNGTSKYDGAFYIYPVLGDEASSDEFFNDRMFQTIKSKRKNKDTAVINIPVSNITREKLPSEVSDYVNDRSKMKKISFNLHSDGRSFFVHEKNTANISYLSANDVATFLSNNIHNKEQNNNLTIAFYSCKSADNLNGENNSLLFQVSDLLKREGFSGIKLTGVKGLIAVVNAPGDRVISFSEDKDLKFSVNFPAPVGSLVVNNAEEAKGSEKYSKSDRKVSINI